jgi:hypothetical protein
MDNYSNVTVELREEFSNIFPDVDCIIDKNSNTLKVIDDKDILLYFGLEKVYYSTITKLNDDNTVNSVLIKMKRRMINNE